MVAFLGMGLLGSNFVKAMLKKGGQVNVWNRTASRAKALEEFGAKAFDNVADAVKGAERIHIVVKDDAAVNEVLAAASAGFAPGVTIIDHTTTSAAGAIERTEKWTALGYTYLHAPVFMGPPNALESTGTMLVSGNQEVIAKWQPELEKMTGKVINFGTRVDKAAGMKLAGNLFLIGMTASVADTLALVKALDIPVSDVSALFDSWNPVAMLPARIKKITSNTFDQPSWELAMSRKDAGLMIAEAKKGNTKLMVIPAIAAEMDSRIAEGLGASDWTVIAKDSVGKL